MRSHVTLQLTSCPSCKESDDCDGDDAFLVLDCHSDEIDADSALSVLAPFDLFPSKVTSKSQSNNAATKASGMAMFMLTL